MKAHFSAYPSHWGLRRPDRNIDHRRVPNLQTWLKRQGAQRDGGRAQPGLTPQQRADPRLELAHIEGFGHIVIGAEIQPAQTLAMRRLEAGEGVRFSLHAIGEVERVSEQRQAAWTEGVLHAEHMPLSELLAELGRYRRGHLSCDPALADLPVSGTFTLDDTDRILAALASELPLEVNHVTRYWVVLRPGRSARPA